MIMYLFLLIIIILLAYIVIIINKQTNRKQGLHPPGPLGLPFIGNLHQFDRANPHLYLWKLSLKYGPLARLKHGFNPILVVSSAKMAKEFLQTHDLVFCTRPPVVGQQKLSFDGLDIAFSPYNEHWKKMRKICIYHLFGHNQVLSFRPTRENEVSHMVTKITRLASSSQLANISEIAMSLASNLICRVAFGRRYDGDEFQKRRFDRLVAEAQNLMVGFYFYDYFPPFGWLDKFTKKSARLERLLEDLDKFYEELIDEHLNPTLPNSDKDDIVSRMLELQHDQENSSSINHIKALLMDLYVAGTDTVAAVIVWAMTALMMRPRIMKTAQSEIRDIIGEKGTVNEENIKKFPYLKAVIMESLRLYPPAPLLFRKLATDSTLGQCSSDTTINGYKIEPGSWVIINGWAISRDPETWNDPHTFRPERFLEDENRNSGKVVDFAMVPFGGGRRGCPGGSMGLLSVELAVANLLYHFDWDLPCGMKMIDTDALPGLTMHKKNALILVPKRVG